MQKQKCIPVHLHWIAGNSVRGVCGLENSTYHCYDTNTHCGVRSCRTAVHNIKCDMGSWARSAMMQCVVFKFVVFSAMFSVQCAVCSVQCASLQCSLCSDDRRLIQDEPQYPPCFCLQFGPQTAGKSRNRQILNTFAKFFLKLKMSNSL